jgi:ATP-dependent exoDNAse (exonuclease V) beta subunit
MCFPSAALTSVHAVSSVNFSPCCVPRFTDRDLSFAPFLLGDIFACHLSSDGKVTKTDLQRLIHTASHRKPYRVPLYSEFRQSYPDLWTKYFDELYRLVGYLPVYDLISEVYKVLRLFDVVPREEAALIKLLDVLKQFEGSDQNSLKDFLEFASDEGERSNWQVAVPQDVNAVRIMTVHKAKGLEFKVVIVVLYDRDLRSERYFFKEEPEGIRLLKISSKVAERVEYLGTIFEEQKQNDRVDTLNKLYVALTRAKDEMFVIGVEGSRELIPSRFLRMVTPATDERTCENQDDDNDRMLHPYHHNLRHTRRDYLKGSIH